MRLLEKSTPKAIGDPNFITYYMLKSNYKPVRSYDYPALDLSFAGALTRRTTHAFTAALSFVGSLTTAAVHFFTKALTGGLSFVGAFAKRPGKTLTGAVSFVGASPIRRVGHGMTGAVSFTGNVSRAIRTRLAGVLSFIGDLTKSGTGIPTVPVPAAAKLRASLATPRPTASRAGTTPRAG
jgi:hypothetical protein